MATKYLNEPKKNYRIVREDSDSFIDVMKPFVKFGFKALTIMGGAMIDIVKAIPKPHDNKPANKDIRIIKIK